VPWLIVVTGDFLVKTQLELYPIAQSKHVRIAPWLFVIERLGRMFEISHVRNEFTADMGVVRTMSINQVADFVGR
jgi:hypothetical protein